MTPKIMNKGEFCTCNEKGTCYTVQADFSLDTAKMGSGSSGEAKPMSRLVA